MLQREVMLDRFQFICYFSYLALFYKGWTMWRIKLFLCNLYQINAHLESRSYDNPSLHTRKGWSSQKSFALARSRLVRTSEGS